MAYNGLETAKPTKPIQRGDLFIFPKTTADQIIIDEDTDERLPDAMFSKFAGSNPITSTADDTVANWAAIGSGLYFFDESGQVTSRPSDYGYVLNLAMSTGEVAQQWIELPQGRIWRRSGNIYGFNNDWTEMLDTSNHKVLLWENASPTSSFATQTISLDLSEYDEIEIIYRLGTSSTYCKNVSGKIDSFVSMDFLSQSSSKIWGAYRTAQILETGVKFANATTISPSTASDGITNYIIPIEIYGIKGVQ